VSESNSTRSTVPARNPHYREHARAAIAALRAGGPSLDQANAIARIRVRMHGRANRHELGTWRDADAAGVELIACLHCGAAAYLDRATATERVVELLEACR
jgi:hypothetical protein